MSHTTSHISPADQRYWAIVRRQFFKNRVAVWSLRILVVIFIIGISADFMANERPYYCVISGQAYYPLLTGVGVDLGITKWPPELSNVTWADLKYDQVIWAPIPYSPGNLDKKNADYTSPFAHQRVASPHWIHHLGTDDLGRDVLSGMIHGTRVAMLVGVISMSVALLIGLLFGSLAGYYGDTKLKMSRLGSALYIPFLFFAFFYALLIRGYILADALAISYFSFMIQLLISLLVFVLIMSIPYAIVRMVGTRLSTRYIEIPLDIIIFRIIETVESVPSFLLILSIVAIVEHPSLYVVMAIIGLTRWTGIARYVRGEMLKVRSLEYIEAAQALGYSEWRIMLRHTLPNSLTPVLISVSFGIASAILIESSLSFLGIGVPAEQVTWGSMLSMVRGYPQAWWVAIFPGLAIFITVTVFNLIGDGLTDALDPRLKH